MKIKADVEGINIIKQLCDIVLKAGGLETFHLAKIVFENLEDIKNGQD